MVKEVALYARVSTENQNLDRQVKKLKNWVKEKGYNFNLYSEKVSSIKERPKFKKLMEKVGDYDVVAVTKIDRFGRSLQDILQKINLIQDKGVDFVTIDQPINTEDEMMGDIMTKLLALFAEFERKMIRKRLEEGYEEALKKGKVGRPSALTEKQKDKVEEMYEKGASYKFLANHYDVSKATIYRTLKERNKIKSNGRKKGN